MASDSRQFYEKLFLSAVLCIGGGWLSGLVTRQGIADWYSHLIQPPGTPPNLVFPIVWTILYACMATSLALVWSSPFPSINVPITLFFLQLMLNFSWSWIFFGMRNPGLALIDLILLWMTLIATILAFRKHSALSAYLLLPYLAWVTYAFYLNLFVWIYNP